MQKTYNLHVRQDRYKVPYKKIKTKSENFVKMLLIYVKVYLIIEVPHCSPEAGKDTKEVLKSWDVNVENDAICEGKKRSGDGKRLEVRNESPRGRQPSCSALSRSILTCSKVFLLYLVTGNQIFDCLIFE